MRIIEIILLGIFIVTLFVGQPTISKSVLPQTFPLLTLSAFYGYTGFILFTKIAIKNVLKSSSYSNLKTFDIIASVFAGVAMAGVLIGMLFKLNHWPGSIFQVFFGCLLIVVVTIIAFMRIKSTNAYIYKAILLRTLPALLLSIFNLTSY